MSPHINNINRFSPPPPNLCLCPTPVCLPVRLYSGSSTLCSRLSPLPLFCYLERLHSSSRADCHHGIAVIWRFGGPSRTRPVNTRNYRPSTSFQLQTAMDPNPPGFSHLSLRFHFAVTHQASDFHHVPELSGAGFFGCLVLISVLRLFGPPGRALTLT